ncbi:unnamed protein product [Coregonus sp. 'balchen']|nr:unnamed protein product [Coregonus sp. 'balchen']
MPSHGVITTACVPGEKGGGPPEETALLVSSIHAIMATTAGVIVVSACSGNVMTDSHYYRFRVKGHEEYKEHSLTTINSFVRREFLLVLHHIALLTILLPVTLFFRKDQGDYFIGCLFLTELSTPFVSLGKILIQLGLQDCWVHKANGGMVLLSFFLCRIALFPYMYWVYGRHYGIPVYGVPFHLTLSVNLGNLCILAPQVYWFVLLCRKGWRLYQRQLLIFKRPLEGEEERRRRGLGGEEEKGARRRGGEGG